VAAEVALVRVAAGHCRVEGRVTHASARSAYEATQGSLAGLLDEAAVDGLDVDLSGMASGNSLVLSLMLSWWRQARRAGREIRFVGVPAALGEQARFTGLGGILPLAEDARA
jgi:ABC-type transporter Mla MlaB component